MLYRQRKHKSKNRKEREMGSEPAETVLIFYPTYERCMFRVVHRSPQPPSPFSILLLSLFGFSLIFLLLIVFSSLFSLSRDTHANASRDLLCRQRERDWIMPATLFLLFAFRSILRTSLISYVYVLYYTIYIFSRCYHVQGSFHPGRIFCLFRVCIRLVLPMLANVTRKTETQPEGHKTKTLSKHTNIIAIAELVWQAQLV